MSLTSGSRARTRIPKCGVEGLTWNSNKRTNYLVKQAFYNWFLVEFGRVAVINWLVYWLNLLGNLLDYWWIFDGPLVEFAGLLVEFAGLLVVFAGELV